MKPELVRKRRVDGLRHSVPLALGELGSAQIIDLNEARARRGLLLQEANITPEPATPGATLEAVEVDRKDFDQGTATLEAFESTNIVSYERFLWYALRKRGAEKQPVVLDDSVQALLDQTVTKGRVWVGEHAIVSLETEAGAQPVYRAVVVEGRFNGGYRRLAQVQKKKVA